MSEEEIIQNKDIPNSVVNENDKQSEIQGNTQSENIPEAQENSRNNEETVIQEEKQEKNKEEKIEEKNKEIVEEESKDIKKEETTIKEENNNNPNLHNSNKNLNEDNKEVEVSGKQSNEYKNDGESEEEDNDEKEEENNEDELISENTTTPRNTNSPVTPGTDKLSKKEKKRIKKKELLMLREKKKQQEKKEKNKIRYLSEEEIDLAFKWFTNGKSVISSNDIKNCFDQYFTNVSKNDKKYYVIGGIKQDTRHLVNTREEKIQSEMFNSTQSLSSLKKMLLKYPFKIKDYDNAFSILCGSDQTDILSKDILNKYIDIFKENEVPVKNDIDKIFKCFDKDNDGELGISDLFKMKKFDLKKISDDYV